MTAKLKLDQLRLSRVLFLLALSVFINYLDRGNLSIAAPLLKNEFQLSATQLGVLLSSFFWTYSFFLPVSGSLVDRLDVCRRFISVVRSDRGYRSDACIRHIDPRANGVGRGRIGFLSSLLDHLV